MYDYEELGPGLHRVGPANYDFVYNPAEGRRVTFSGFGDEDWTGVIQSFTRDKKTGEISMTMEDGAES